VRKTLAARRCWVSASRRLGRARGLDARARCAGGRRWRGGRPRGRCTPGHHTLAFYPHSAARDVAPDRLVATLLGVVAAARGSRDFHHGLLAHLTVRTLTMYSLSFRTAGSKGGAAHKWLDTVARNHPVAHRGNGLADRPVAAALAGDFDTHLPFQAKATMRHIVAILDRNATPRPTFRRGFRQESVLTSGRRHVTEDFHTVA
jgi:hypothetical protein